MANILGLKGTGQFAANERPENWHEGILYLWPHGKAPLLSLMSKAKRENVDDWHIHWFEQDLVATREIPAADIDAYDTGAMTVTFASVKPLMIGSVLRQISGTAATIRLTGKVSDKKWIFVVDDGAKGSLTTAQTLTLIGTAHNEGAELPEGYSIQPAEKETYCQIFRTPVKISRTAKKTHLRTGNAQANEKKNTLHMIGMDIEMAMLLGKGSSSEPRRMKGVYELLAANYKTDPAFTDLSTFWGVCEKVFSYGSSEKLCLSGANAITKLMGLVEGKVRLERVPVDVYGIKMTRWVTPWGDLYIKTHPLLSAHSILTGYMFMLDMAHLSFEYIDDIIYKDYKDAAGYDAAIGEYLAECAIKLEALKAHHIAVA